MDDGSTDATPARLADCRDPRLQVIRLETNVGRAVAKNHALERVRGSYVAFMDGDDESEPHRLQVQVAFLGQQGLRFVPGHYVEDHELWTQALRTVQFANLPDVLLNHHHVLADRVEDTRAKERGIMPVVLSQVRALGIRPTDRQRQLHSALCRPGRKPTADGRGCTRLYWVGRYPDGPIPPTRHARRAGPRRCTR